MNLAFSDDFDSNSTIMQQQPEYREVLPLDIGLRKELQSLSGAEELASCRELHVSVVDGEDC